LKKTSDLLGWMIFNCLMPDENKKSKKKVAV